MVPGPAPAPLSARERIASRCAPGLVATTASGIRRPDLLADALVALTLEALDELLAALHDDAPVQHHVDELGLDVVEDALVVGDDQRAHALLGVELGDALGNGPQCV